VAVTPPRRTTSGSGRWRPTASPASPVRRRRSRGRSRTAPSA